MFEHKEEIYKYSFNVCLEHTSFVPFGQLILVFKLLDSAVSTLPRISENWLDYWSCSAGADLT